jgi:flavorubredoxin
MESRVDEISDGIYRISTCIEGIAPDGFTFNQFLVDADEPLIFHTGMRQLFPLVSEAVSRVTPVDRLRWISFGHVEADECGSMNEFLAAAPQATVAHGGLACMLSLNDLCDRPPRPLSEGEVLELGGGASGPRVRELGTPHVPHNWESHLLFEERTRTLFCGDLLSQTGDGAPVTDANFLDAAIATEEMFGQTGRGPAVPATLRQLADLEPKTLAIMHGSSYNGDCPALLRAMADVFETRLGCGLATAGSAA